MRAAGLVTGIVVARDATSADAPEGGQTLDRLDGAQVPPWPAGSGATGEEPWGVWVILDHWEAGTRLPGNAVPRLMPVASMFAGRESGSQFLPRTGTSVYVRFIDDDPEQPVVIGCAHHAGTPYPFPPDQTDLPLVPTGEDDESLMRQVVTEEKMEEPDEEASEESGGDKEAEDKDPRLDVPATVAAANGAEGPDDVTGAVPASDDADGASYDIAPGESKPLVVNAAGCSVTGMTSKNGRNHVLFDDAAPNVVLKADKLHVTYVGGDHMVNVRGDLHRVTGATETLHEGLNWLWAVGRHHTRIDGASDWTRKGVHFTMVRKGELHLRYGAVHELFGGVRLEVAKNDKWVQMKPDTMQLKAIGRIALAPAFKDNQTTRLRLAVLRKHKTKTQTRESEMFLRLAVKGMAELDDLTRDIKVVLSLAKEETTTLDERTRKGLLLLDIAKTKEYS